MGMSFMSVIMSVVLLSGGSDLLDFWPTEYYWKQMNVKVDVPSMLAQFQPPKAAADVSALIKKLSSDNFKERDDASRQLAGYGPEILPQLQEAAKSSDAEVAERAARAIEAIKNRQGNFAGARRLMAIRTLGELKAKEALPQLKELLDSKKPFEADYAQAAIAAIEGKAYTRPQPTAADWQSDLELLPRNCGVVIQGHYAAITPIDALVKSAKLTREQIAPMLAPIMQMGNARLYGATLAVSETISGNTGFVIIIFRGQYDSKAAIELFKGLKAGSRSMVTEIEGVPVIQVEHEAAFIPCSDQRLIMVVGPNQQQMPLKELAAAIKSGKGELMKNEAMARLIKAADTTADIWGVMNSSESYKAAEELKGFETMTAAVKEKDGQMTARLEATGKDAAELAASADKLKAGLEELKRERELQPEGPFGTSMADLRDAMESVQFKTDGAKMTATAKSKTTIQNIIAKPILAIIGMEFGRNRKDISMPAGDAMGPGMIED